MWRDKQLGSPITPHTQPQFVYCKLKPQNVSQSHKILPSQIFHFCILRDNNYKVVTVSEIRKSFLTPFSTRLIICNRLFLTDTDIEKIKAIPMIIEAKYWRKFSLGPKFGLGPKF